MAAWPPTMDDLLVDMKLAGLTLTDEQTAELQQTLDSAVAYVERVRDDIDFTDVDLDVPADLYLGTLRYARRLDLRRESPVGMVFEASTGITANVPGWDNDIEKNLQVGRYSRIKFA